MFFVFTAAESRAKIAPAPPPHTHTHHHPSGTDRGDPVVYPSISVVSILCVFLCWVVVLWHRACVLFSFAFI